MNDCITPLLNIMCVYSSCIFYSQVGGEFFEVTLSNMNEFGHVSICGAISLYNATEKPKCIYNLLDT